MTRNELSTPRRASSRGTKRPKGSSPTPEVSEEHTGRGVGTAAVGAAAELAYGKWGLHRLQAATLVHNLGSQRVLQRNGDVGRGSAQKLAGRRDILDADLKG